MAEDPPSLALAFGARKGEITLADLEARHQAVVTLLARLQQESDPRQLQALGNQLAREGAALEELTRAFETQELAKAGPPLRGRIEVVLTEEQRARVRDRTGVDLPVFFLEDAAGALNRAMPQMAPQQIEEAALREAMGRRAAAETRGQAGAQLEAALAEIEASGGKNVKELVAQLRADPRWARLR
jgi:hypothetical protein